MPLLPFGEYKPDVSDYEGQATRNIRNVQPRGDGYGPFPDFAILTQALPAGCRGGFYALKSDSSVAVFAGTSTKLYLADNTDYSWDDVSLGAGTYSALSSDAQWQFAQFGNLVFATQKNAVLQVFDLSSSSAFANCGGSPPQAAYISVVGRFLVLSGLLSNPFRIHWSGLNATTTWTSGVNSSDFQDFPDGGIVRGVAGGEFGTVFQDQAIRRMSYIPGSPLIFQIERIAQDLGLFAPYSIVRAGSLIFFHSAQGFYKIAPGGIPEQIGREKVDRSFFDELDKTELRMFIGASDPRSTRVFWAYKSTSGTTGLYDKIIGYDSALERFFPISMVGEYLLGMSQPGITLENLDTLSASIDALAASLDSFAVSTQPLIAGFNSDHKMGFFSGSALEATLETAEQGADGEQIFCSGFRPVTDSPTVYGSLSYRNLTSETPTSLPEIARNSRTGNCDLRRSTKFTRMKIRIPASTSWTFAAGVHPSIGSDGQT
jgi:hypothetical protein